MTRALRWFPGLLIAALLGMGVYAVTTGQISLPRNTANVNAGIAPSPTPGLQTADAVIAAVKEYYRVTDIARGNGNVDLVDQVTFSVGSPANVNFREFMRQQLAKNHLAVITSEKFKDWVVSIEGEQATASYTNWLTGRDIDAKTGVALEVDMTLSPNRYTSRLRLKSLHTWVVVVEERIAADVP